MPYHRSRSRKDHDRGSGLSGFLRVRFPDSFLLTSRASYREKQMLVFDRPCRHQAVFVLFKPPEGIFVAPSRPKLKTSSCRLSMELYQVMLCRVLSKQTRDSTARNCPFMYQVTAFSDFTRYRDVLVQLAISSLPGGPASHFFNTSTPTRRQRTHLPDETRATALQ